MDTVCLDNSRATFNESSIPLLLTNPNAKIHNHHDECIASNPDSF